MHILRHVIHRLFEAAGDDGAAGGEGAGQENQPDAQAVEQRAREMGWAPKDQWRGNPSHWLDAQTFVQRGEQVMPVLQANLRKRDVEVATLRQQLERQNQQLAAQNESIQVLTNLSTEQSRQAAKEKRRELLKQQVEARREGDADLEIELGEQIADVTAEITAAEAAPATTTAKKPVAKQPASQQPPPNDPQTDPVNDPSYQAFLSENPWYGTDLKRTALATAVGRELRMDPQNNTLQGKAFFDRVAAEVNKIFAPARATTSKVEGATNGGGAPRTDADPATGKSYADLPQDAKDACERYAKQVVGEGRAFKDIASWRKHYVTQYFNS